MSANRHVLMLINTTGIDYDDRLRKESLSVLQCGRSLEVVALESANTASQRIAFDSIKARTIKLFSRRLFRSTRCLTLKTSEMYAQMLYHVVRRRPEVVWCHNLETSGLVVALWILKKIGIIARVVWDQHELPSNEALKSKLRMKVFQHLMERCDVVVMANAERIAFLQGVMKGRMKTPVETLENFPDQVFRDLPMAPLPSDLLDWLDGSEYIVAQGGASPHRHFEELVQAVMQMETMKMVVVGPFRESEISKMNRRYGDEWKKRVFFTSFVPQLELARYIDHAVASVVFYTTERHNSNLCAPNRLYQAICRGVPVVVGKNPPMARLVGKLQCGAVVDHYDVESIRRGIELVQGNRERYSSAAAAARKSLVWEDQMESVRRIVGC